MSESLSSNESLQPPVLSEQEAQAVLAAQERLLARRVDAEGNQVSEVTMAGVTPDGLFVAVETTLERNPFADKPDVTFLGNPMQVTGYRVSFAAATELDAGGGLSEEEPEHVLKFRSTGPSISTSIGRISYGNQIPGRPKEESGLPKLVVGTGEERDIRSIYPIGPDGQPFDPSQKKAAEAAAAQARTEAEARALAEVQPAQVVLGGAKRGFFSRMRRK